jgi:hypothetical protein
MKLRKEKVINSHTLHRAVVKKSSAVKNKGKKIAERRRIHFLRLRVEFDVFIYMKYTP